VFEAIRCALEAIARRGPTVVFLDDLHWADATTLGLLPALAAGLVDEPRLFLHPVVLGSGARLFDDAPLSLELAECRAYDNGVASLIYHPRKT
jgi:predicted ATPase